MEVELLHLTPNAEEFIGRCASICYDSSQDSGACVKRAAACVSKGHLATLRFAHATFKVKGISRACSHQFVRSKHLDFLQRSQRYCNEKDVKFVYPPDDEWELVYRVHYMECLDKYNRMIKNGVKKEDIYFKDIRSFLKQKSIFGYQFFIYEKTKIEPKFGFTFFSIHKAIAIEELLKSKINKAINEKQKVDLQIAKERSLENNETISLSQMRKLSDEQI